MRFQTLALLGAAILTLSSFTYTSPDDPDETITTTFTEDGGPDSDAANQAFRKACRNVDQLMGPESAYVAHAVKPVVADYGLWFQGLEDDRTGLMVVQRLPQEITADLLQRAKKHSVWLLPLPSGNSTFISIMVLTSTKPGVCEVFMTTPAEQKFH